MNTDSDHRDPESYLRITGLSRALLINFGAPSLESKRLILTPEKSV